MAQPPGFPEALTGPGNPGEEAPGCSLPFGKEPCCSGLLGWKQGFRCGAVTMAPSPYESNTCGPPRDVWKPSRRSPPSCTLPRHLCARPAPSTDRVPCPCDHIRAPSHEPSCIISCSVPMHRDGHLTFLSSWQIMVLPSLPRVHLVLPTPRSGQSGTAGGPP